jgi:hypothetical protein
MAAFSSLALGLGSLISGGASLINANQQKKQANRQMDEQRSQQTLLENEAKNRREQERINLNNVRARDDASMLQRRARQSVLGATPSATQSYATKNIIGG